MAAKSHSSSDDFNSSIKKWQEQSAVWLRPNPGRDKKDHTRLVSAKPKPKIASVCGKRNQRPSVCNKSENTTLRHEYSWRNQIHLIDYFKVDAKRRSGIQATDFPLIRATNTKLLEVRRGIKKTKQNKKATPVVNCWWKVLTLRREGHLHYLILNTNLNLTEKSTITGQNKVCHLL